MRNASGLILSRLFFFSLFFLPFHLFASSAAIDSLEALLPAKTGKEKINLLFQLSYKYTQNGSLEKALEYSQQALSDSKQENSLLGEGNAYNQIANIYDLQSERDKSVENYLKAFNVYEKTGNKRGIANVLNCLGNIYRAMRNYDKALSYFLESINVWKELNEKFQVAAGLNNLGTIYYDQSNFKKAIEYFQSALAIYNEGGMKQLEAQVENNIGGAYNELKEFEPAIVNFKNAMQIYSELKNDDGIAMCLGNIGNIYTESGKPKEGIEYDLKSLALSRLVNDKDNIASAYIYLEEGFEKMGDYKKALEYQTKLLDLKDTLYDLNSNHNVAEMQTRFDTEKKEKQNKILKQTVEIQELNANRDRIIIYSISLLVALLITLAFFIYRSYRQKHIANEQLAQKNAVIQEKSKIVEEQNKDIKDSIRYAKRLQEAILSPEAKFREVFPDSFILFKPKDIVSGDFYWFERFGDQAFFAAADCTGHGVPGAFMSILGFNLLNQAVNEYALTVPSVILNSVNKGLTKALHAQTDGTVVKDGMDIALCGIDMKKNILQCAGAYNPVWIIRDGKVIEFSGDKFPIGEFVGEEVKKFTNHEMQLIKGDCVYVFSDGYADQFGGPKGKKFKYKPMQDLLIGTSGLPMQEQMKILDRTNEEWKGRLEQIDDILIIGIRI